MLSLRPSDGSLILPTAHHQHVVGPETACQRGDASDEDGLQNAVNNHSHLLFRTQNANLSDAIGWLQVTYSGVFNWTQRISQDATLLHPFALVTQIESSLAK